MAGRKIRDEKDAQSCVAAAKAAGLAQTEWARLHGIDGRSLFAWGIKLGQVKKAPHGKPKRSRRKSGRLVELIPEERPPKQPARYLVRCGQFDVEVDGNFNETILARLLSVVATC